MARPTSSARPTIVVLGTGGTIAGAAPSPSQTLRYQSAQRPVQALLTALTDEVPALSRARWQAEQVAQVDSKDMSHALWALIARRCAHHLARAEVSGIVLTHGTDTLEETAWLLHRVLAPRKPLVLTAAMRPATALGADGPRNLLDALRLAAEPGAAGVLLAFAGRAWAGAEVRKVHSTALDAFDAGGHGPVALLGDAGVERLRAWPLASQGAGSGDDAATVEGRRSRAARKAAYASSGGDPQAAPVPGPAGLPTEEAHWPWVEIVNSHGGAGERAVEALLAAGVQGLVVATTGNGTVHADLERALAHAVAVGVPVLRATRCAAGGVVPAPDDAPPALASAQGLTPAQARVELLLRLLWRQPAAGATLRSRRPASVRSESATRASAPPASPPRRRRG